MSRNLISKEEAINQLYATIKAKFEQDGVLQEVRCLLQSKMVTMMKGKGDPATSISNAAAATNTLLPTLSDAGSSGDGLHRDVRMQLLHQLIMEYFHWHGFYYSAEMLSMESSTENSKPVRECLEGALGTFEHKNMPILLELMTNLLEKKNK